MTRCHSLTALEDARDQIPRRIGEETIMRELGRRCDSPVLPYRVKGRS